MTKIDLLKESDKKVSELRAELQRMEVKTVVVRETPKARQNTFLNGKDFGHLLDLGLLNDDEFEHFMESMQIVTEVDYSMEAI
jgi:hypothetical protein